MNIKGIMKREELLKSAGYWIAEIQIGLYNCAVGFMEKHKMNRTQLAAYLGVSKGYVTQLLSGDYNFSLEKLVELALALGYVPQMAFEPKECRIARDRLEVKPASWRPARYSAKVVAINKEMPVTAFQSVKSDKEQYICA